MSARPRRASSPKAKTKAGVKARAAEPGVLEGVDASLLDIVDHVLTKGIVLTGDLVLGVADIDLVYLRLSAVLCAADRILGKSPDSEKRRARHTALTGPSTGGGVIASRLGSPRFGSKR
jgi:hypothetical protein